MSFQSILDLKEGTYISKIRPAFFIDLNLDKVIDNIQYQWVSDIKKFFYYFPADKECEAYRREVYGDIKKPQVLEALMSYVNLMRSRKDALEKKNQV